MGDPSKIIFLEALVETVNSENLLENVKSTGNYFFAGLKEIEVLLAEISISVASDTQPTRAACFSNRKVSKIN